MSGFGTFSEKCTIDFTKFGSNGILAKQAVPMQVNKKKTAPQAVVPQI